MRREYAVTAVASLLLACVPVTGAAAGGVIYDGVPPLEMGGWKFQPFGRIQRDFGYVEKPEGVAATDLRWEDELRALRMGARLSTPFDLSAKVEVEVAGDYAEITDAVLEYAAGNATFIAGQLRNFSSLEELTSSRFTSFMERAAFTDAFNFQRRVGGAVEYADGDILGQVGIFTDNLDDFETRKGTPISVDARAVWMPEHGGAQLHLGGSLHLRDYDLDDNPGDTVRYRQRPQFHATDTRFVATPRLPVERETSMGLEAAAVRGPWHVAAETHWFGADLSTGPDANFFGGYAEIGYFLTPGDTRAYKEGKFDRIKPKSQLGQGGIGAVQINLRFDHLDLTDGAVRGGHQNSWLASLIWTPTNRTRLIANGGIVGVSDTALTAAGGDDDYSAGIFAVRAQFDF